MKGRDADVDQFKQSKWNATGLKKVDAYVEVDQCKHAVMPPDNNVTMLVSDIYVYISIPCGQSMPYSVQARFRSCLQMPWLIMLPGHQQAWYWLCGSSNSHQLDIEWYQMQMNNKIYLCKRLIGMFSRLSAIWHISLNLYENMRVIFKQLTSFHFPCLSYRWVSARKM